MFSAVVGWQVFEGEYCVGCGIILFFLLQGFLAKDLQAEALKQLDKRIKGTAEQFMKTLEQIDAIVSN